MRDNDQPRDQVRDNDFYRMWIIPGLVFIGILAVVLIYSMALRAMPQTAGTDSLKSIGDVTSIAVGMIGTLVSFAVGQSAGAAGKEKAENRAIREQAEKETEMKKAMVYWGNLSPEEKESALKDLASLSSQ